MLGTAKVAELEDVRTSVDEDILRFDITMANSFSVNVCNRTQQLVRVNFNEQVGNHLLHFQILLHYAVSRIRDVIHNHVQIHLIFLVPARVEGLAHLDAVWVMQLTENLKLAILISLVLEHFFNGDRFPSFSDGGLEHDSKRTIANDFFSVIGEALLLNNDQN